MPADEGLPDRKLERMADAGSPVHLARRSGVEENGTGVLEVADAIGVHLRDDRRSAAETA